MPPGYSDTSTGYISHRNMGQESAAFSFVIVTAVEALRQFQLNRHLTMSLIAIRALLGLAEAIILQKLQDDAIASIDLNQRLAWRLDYPYPARKQHRFTLWSQAVFSEHPFVL